MDQQTVMITCVTCQETWSRSLVEINDDDTLGEVAKDFLAEHATCGVSIALTGEAAGAT